MSMMRVKVLGLGNYGYAILKHLDRKNSGQYALSGFTRNPQIIQEIQSGASHPAFTDVTPLSKEVVIESSLDAFIADCDILILAISSNALPDVLGKIKHYVNTPVTIVNTSKALDHRTGEPFSKVVESVFFDTEHTYAMVSGATVAKDLIQEVPLGVTMACGNKDVLHTLKSLFETEYLTVVPTSDVVGVEYAAAFKNVLSIYSGMFHGMGYKIESEIFAVTKVAAEIEKLVTTEFSGSPDTFTLSSPCWGNDIWMSCTTPTRNRELGVMLGRGNRRSIYHPSPGQDNRFK
jgi:glycerol-3-phosphate dehydrogenase (NAD(P)+)